MPVDLPQGTLGVLKYNRRTASGRRKFQQRARGWNRMSKIMAGILSAAPEQL